MPSLMTPRRLLLLDANRLSAYHWQNGHIKAEGEFLADPPGLEAFAEYLNQHASSLFTLLADVAEEGFQIEEIPRVQGKDKEAIITRRLGQYFYGSPYAAALSLGRETTGRKDERMLFAALTRPPQIDPWIGLIKETGSQLVALHSAPFLVAEIVKGLGPQEGRLLVLTIGKGGLRQTYFENGQFRFSRLTPLALGSVEEIALACASEAEKIYQYLVGQRMVERGARIRTLVVSHPAEQSHLREKCRGTSDLSFEFIDLLQEAGKRGLKTLPATSHSELLLLHLLVRNPPASQFAPFDARKPYRIWQFKFALNAFALTGLAACLLFAAKTALDAYSLQDQIGQIRQEVGQENQRYEAMLKTLPAVPIKLDELRALVDRFDELEKRSPTFKSALIPLSQALDKVPQVELEKFDWILSSNPEENPTRVVAAQAGNGSRPAGNTPVPQAATPQGAYFSIIELEAKLPIGIANDHRAMLAAIDSFKTALQQTDNLTVKVLRMPFDTESGKTIKSTGDVGAAKADAPGFAVRIVQKVF